MKGITQNEDLAVAALYFGYSAAIATTWAIGKYLFETVVVCLGLHLSGLIAGYFMYGFDAIYLIELKMPWFSRALFIWDAIQTIALIIMIALQGAFIKIAATIALLGVALCLRKAFLIIHVAR